tara:strand:- start:76 stop:744 length:669 start_codon:yes stop_codon:yes gene_type:complete
MHSIYSAITTAERDGEDYLPTTLRSLRDAGFADTAIFAEPNAPAPANLHVIRNLKKRGAYPNFLHALKWLTFSKPFADAYIVWQDDIEVSLGLRQHLNDLLWPADRETIGVVSLYAAGLYGLEGEGLVNITDHRAYGALAYVFPRHAAVKLTSDPPRRGSLTMTDVSVGEFCRREGLSYWVHNPSLVRHIGDVSSISSRNKMKAVVPGARNCVEFAPQVPLG